MLSELTQNWWLFLVRGFVAIVFGLLALVWPSQVWLAFAVVLGVFTLLDGIVTLLAGIDLQRYFDAGWAVLLQGVMGIVFGALVLVWPKPASEILFYLVAAWAVLRGIFEIVVATRMRLFVSGEWFMILSGVLSILFGLLLFVYPQSGLVALVWVMGIYALASGISQIIFAARLNSLRTTLKSGDATGM